MVQNKSRAVGVAGGQGTRLSPLTDTRTKVAMPFSKYRLLDLLLSNMKNSLIPQLDIIVQMKTRSFLRHMKSWYAYYGIDSLDIHAIQNEPSMGSAHAVYQIGTQLFDSNFQTIYIFAGDHVMLFDVDQMNQYHLNRKADMTIATIKVPRAEASRFGVMTVDSNGRIVEFNEKPKHPAPIPGDFDYSLISMGNYAFYQAALKTALEVDNAKEYTRDIDLIKSNPDRYSARDFGTNVIPWMVKNMDVFAYDFLTNKIPGLPDNVSGYWRDVGEIASYYNAVMDLLEDENGFRKSPLAYDLPDWPIFTNLERSTPPYITRGSNVQASNLAEATVIDHATVLHSDLSYAVNAYPGSIITDSIAMGYNKIGEDAVIQRTILERGVEIPPKTTIGKDLESDRKRGFRTLEHEVAVVPKGFTNWDP